MITIETKTMERNLSQSKEFLILQDGTANFALQNAHGHFDMHLETC